MRLEFSEDIKGAIDTYGTRLEVPVDWIPEAQAEKSYLGRGFGNSYFFGQLE